MLAKIKIQSPTIQGLDLQLGITLPSQCHLLKVPDSSQLASCTFLTLLLLYNPNSHLLEENLRPRGLGYLPQAPLSLGQCSFHCTLWAVRVAQKLLRDLRPVMHSRRTRVSLRIHFNTQSGTTHKDYLSPFLDCETCG